MTLCTNETCLCSVLYARLGMFLMRFGFCTLPPLSLNNNTQYYKIPPLRMGGGLSGKMQREITYFLASGKNYFYTISYLLMNHGLLYPTGRIGFFQAYTIGGETSNIMQCLHSDWFDVENIKNGWLRKTGGKFQQNDQETWNWQRWKCINFSILLRKPHFKSLEISNSTVHRTRVIKL